MQEYNIWEYFISGVTLHLRNYFDCLQVQCANNAYTLLLN